MNYYSTQVTNLIEELRRLPGIGSKSAQRLAFQYAGRTCGTPCGDPCIRQKKYPLLQMLLDLD